MLYSALLTLLSTILTVQAATKDEWRSRSIYQVITGRFAPSSPGAACNPSDRAYCGGTWSSLMNNLDYIQGMGYDAVWISPTALGLEGATQDGSNYHGYWGTDPTKLNPHFGTADDLTALSSALHNRGMLLMVDIAINALASLSTDTSNPALASDDSSTLLFKDSKDYHKACNIAWGNRTSEQDCWLTTSGVTLMDLDQSNPKVVKTLTDWVSDYVQTYKIDGFRIDASKHMPVDFQHTFCQAAGVFCIGEVYGDDTVYAGSFTGDAGIDSVFGFGMQYGWKYCFTGTTFKTMNTMKYYIDLAASSYADPTVIGSFLDNQDLPRWNTLTSDKSLVQNAIVGAFLYGGIPTIYYGLEQDLSDGPYDPFNREALWLYNAYSRTTDSYLLIANLNKIRSSVGKENADYFNQVSKVAAFGNTDLAMIRAGVLVILTNRGASGIGSWSVGGTGYAANVNLIELLSCSTATAGSDGSVSVTWTTGEPKVYVTTDVAAAAGLCGAVATSTTSLSASAASSTSTTSVSESSTSSDASGSSTDSSSTSTGGVLVVSANTASASTQSSTTIPSSPTISKTGTTASGTGVAPTTITSTNSDGSYTTVTSARSGSGSGSGTGQPSGSVGVGNGGGLNSGAGTVVGSPGLTVAAILSSVLAVLV